MDENPLSRGSCRVQVYLPIDLFNYVEQIADRLPKHQQTMSNALRKIVREHEWFFSLKGNTQEAGIND